MDKELLPYISLKPGENCQQKGGKCPPPYRSGVNCQAGVNSPSPNFNLAKKRKKIVNCQEKIQIKDSYDFLLMRSRVKKYISIFSISYFDRLREILIR